MTPLPLKKHTLVLKDWLEQKVSGNRKQTLFQPDEKTKAPVEPYYLRAGSTFRRVRKDSTVETAKILGFHDNGGITHVHFEVRFRHPYSPIEDWEGPKILSIEQFSDLYSIKLGLQASGMTQERTEATPKSDITKS